MARVRLTFLSLHNILDHSQFSVIIKYCQYRKLFLTQLFPFLSHSEQVAIFSRKPCSVESPQSIFSAWLVLCRDVDDGFGKLDHRNNAVSFENWFRTVWFQFLKWHIFNAPFVSLSANYTVYYCSNPVGSSIRRCSCSLTHTDQTGHSLQYDSVKPQLMFRERDSDLLHFWLTRAFIRNTFSSILIFENLYKM